jgi:hypothetical protein
MPVLLNFGGTSLPLAFSLSSEALQYDADLKWTRCHASGISERVEGREYLFVSDQFEGDLISYAVPP